MMVPPERLTYHQNAMHRKFMRHVKSATCRTDGVIFWHAACEHSRMRYLVAATCLLPTLLVLQ